MQVQIRASPEWSTHPFQYGKVVSNCLKEEPVFTTCYLWCNKHYFHSLNTITSWEWLLLCCMYLLVSVEWKGFGGSTPAHLNCKQNWEKQSDCRKYLNSFSGYSIWTWFCRWWKKEKLLIYKCMMLKVNNFLLQWCTGKRGVAPDRKADTNTSHLRT